MNFEHGRSTTVKIENGLICGFRYNDVFHFYGIDYAQRPTIHAAGRCPCLGWG